MAKYCQLPLLAIILSICSECIADSPARPRSYSIDLGNKIFVMLSDSSNVYMPMPNNGNCAIGKKPIDPCELDSTYTKSGLYLKNDRIHPLWTVDWYAFSVNLSTDGTYLVRGGRWAGAVQSEAVSFFKSGILIAEYKISDLVDNEEKLSHSVSHFFWREKVVFNDKNNTYFIKTVDENEFVFDVRSGRIIKFRQTPGQIYRARLVYKNGKSKTANGFYSCGILLTNGPLKSIESKHTLFMVEIAEQDGKQRRIENIISVPFSEIKKVEWVSNNTQSVVWKIVTKKGVSRQINYEPGFVQFCSMDEFGKKVNHDPMEIRSIELIGPFSRPIQNGIRNKAQRMRWDKKNWRKAMAPMCKKIDLSKYKTFQEKKNLVRLLTMAKCKTDNSLISLQWIEKWIKNRSMNMDLAVIAMDVGDAYLTSNHEKEAKQLFQYILNKYKNIKKDGKRTTRTVHEYELNQRINIINRNKQIRAKKKEAKAKRKKIVDQRRQNHEAFKKKFFDRVEWNTRYVPMLMNDIRMIRESDIHNEFIVAGDKELLMKICKHGKPESKKEVINIYEQALLKEKKLHPGVHEHTLKAKIALVKCYALLGRARIAKDMYLSALKDEMSLSLKSDNPAHSGYRPYIETLARSAFGKDRKIGNKDLTLFVSNLSRYSVLRDTYGVAVILTVYIEIFSDRHNIETANYMKKGLNLLVESHKELRYTGNTTKWLNNFEEKIGYRNTRRVDFLKEPNNKVD